MKVDKLMKTWTFGIKMRIFVNHPSVLSSANQVNWNSHSIPTTRGQSTLFVAVHAGGHALMKPSWAKSTDAVLRSQNHTAICSLGFWLYRYLQKSAESTLLWDNQDEKNIPLSVWLLPSLLLSKNKRVLACCHNRHWWSSGQYSKQTARVSWYIPTLTLCLWAIPKKGESSPDPGVWLKSRCCA